MNQHETAAEEDHRQRKQVGADPPTHLRVHSRVQSAPVDALLVMLMQLHANRQDDDSDYVRLIRACLEANHGRPNVARRAVIDVGRIASLR
jgi:hypothetical protein